MKVYICKDNTEFWVTLTKGKIYSNDGIKDGMMTTVDDNDILRSYPCSCFEEVDVIKKTV